MPAPTNAFKAALRTGEVQVGTWLGFADSYIAEAAATADFDWFLIDGEHAPNDIPTILSQISVVQGAGRNAVVRLPIGESWMVKQALDLGVQTLLMPMVESADMAKKLVRDCLYPPQGHRGVGAGLARASDFNAISDYLPTANDEICLLVQVENRAGMKDLDNILQVVGRVLLAIGTATVCRGERAFARLERDEGRDFRPLDDPAWSETLACAEAPCSGTGRSHDRPTTLFRMLFWSASGR